MGVAKSRHLAIDEPNVRFWSKTDYGLCIIDVRFWWMDWTAWMTAMRAHCRPAT